MGSLVDNEWEKFYDFHSTNYLNNLYTTNTIREVDFIIKELSLLPTQKILDVGCGVGRHSIELAKRGYSVCGIDISAGQIYQAKQWALKEKVVVDFIKQNALDLSVENEYDAVICLCEGAFGLLGLTENPMKHDQIILNNIYNALKNNGQFLLTALNGYRLIRKYTNDDIKKGIFDPYEQVEYITFKSMDSNASESEFVKQKAFTPPELKLLLQEAGFTIDYICGGTVRRWDKHKLELDEIEIMVKCTKIN